MPVIPEPDFLRDQFLSKFEETLSLQTELVDQDLESLADEHNLTPHELALSKEYLEDLVSIFKFFRRTQYNRTRAKELILDTVLWRIGSSVDYAGTKAPQVNSVQDRERLQGESLAHLRLSSLRTDDESPLKKGLFWFLPGTKDKYGRPVAVMRLKHMVYEEDALRGMKEYVALSVEVGRRLCWEETLKLWEEKGYGKDAVMRYSCVLDLKGVSLSGMASDVLKYTNDLLHHRFPGMTGTVYVANFSWYFTPMWEVAKRTLPQKALRIVTFVNETELKDYVPEDKLPKDLGGISDYEYDYKTNDALQRHANRPQVPVRSLTRNTSFESTSELFYSAPSSPYLRPMTPPIHSSASLNRQPWHQSWDFHLTQTVPRKTVSFIDLDGTRHRCNSITPYTGTRPRSDSVSSDDSTASDDSFKTAPMYQPTKRHRRHDDPLGGAAASLLNLAGHVQGIFRFIADAVLFRAHSSFRKEESTLRTIWKRVGYSMLYYILFLALVSNTSLLSRITTTWRRLRIKSLPGQNEL